MKNRSIREQLVQAASRPHSRILLLTGARQCGKTTLVRAAFPDIPYLSVEDPVLRPSFSRMSASEWVERYPHAIIDEAQKVPALIESIKAAHDLADHVRYLLLGSSQNLLLGKARESLAGRATIRELWPLTLPEIACESWSDPIKESRLIHWLRSECKDRGVLAGMPAAEPDFSRREDDFRAYLLKGGMPAVHNPELSSQEVDDWLDSHRRTYLERDVSDLGNLRDLEPFVLAQRAAGLRTGRSINFSDLARQASVSPATARRFIRYLELSYQVIQLEPYFRNPDKRLSKMPKLHWLDPGVLRKVIGRSGEPTGEEYESAVVAEIYKQIRNARLPARLSHLRTQDGREIDLLIELDPGFIAVEIKMSERVSRTDARHLRDLGEILEKPLLGSLVLSQDREVRPLAEGVMALPAAWVLSG